MTSRKTLVITETNCPHGVNQSIGHQLAATAPDGKINTVLTSLPDGHFVRGAITDDIALDPTIDQCHTVVHQIHNFRNGKRNGEVQYTVELDIPTV